jgi:hypothetical protein
MNLMTRLKSLNFILLGKSGLVVLIFFGLAVVGMLWNESLKPRYLGKTKEAWLRDFSAGNNGVISAETELSPRQKQAIKAFQHFGKEGFDYLAEQMAFTPTTFHKMMAWLHRYQWFRDLGIPFGNGQAAGAYFLLRHLDVPYNWVEPHWKASGNKTSVTDYFKLNLVQSVTNRLDELVPEVASYLTHTNQVVRQNAVVALNKCYEPGRFYPEVEPLLIGLPPSQWSIRPLMEILAKHAIQSPWAQQELMKAVNHQDPSISKFATVAMASNPAMHTETMAHIKDLIQQSIQRAEKHPNAIISIPWLEAFKTVNITLDDSLRHSLLELAQHAFTGEFFQILDILEHHSWEKNKYVVSLVRQRMQPPEYMGYYEFQAFLWLLDRDPEDAETWATFDRIMEKERPIEMPHNIRWLALMSSPSKAAETRLWMYAASIHEPTRLAAEETLAELKTKGLLSEFEMKN